MKNVEKISQRFFVYENKKSLLNEYCSHFFEKSENLLVFLLIFLFLHAIFFFEVKGK